MTFSGDLGSYDNRGEGSMPEPREAASYYDYAELDFQDYPLTPPPQYGRASPLAGDTPLPPRFDPDSSYIRDPFSYPAAFGNEEELDLRAYDSDGKRIFPQPTQLRRAISYYQEQRTYLHAPHNPPIVCEGSVRGSSIGFDSTGSRMYVDPPSIEHSTAETPSIREAAAAIRTRELVVLGLGEAILHTNPIVETVEHRRHVGLDTQATIGTQDNLYVPASPPDGLMRLYSDDSNTITSLATAICLTAPVMYGSGDYTRGTLAFGQKMSAYPEIGFPGEGVELVDCLLESQQRLEIRQPDINMHDGTTMRRLASCALGVALARTPFINLLGDFINNSFIGRDRLDWPDRFNIADLLPDGTFDPDENVDIKTALDWHMYLAELFLSDKMVTYAGTQPTELRVLAEDIYRYAELAGKVLRGQEPLQALAPHSDWAAKHAAVLQQAERLTKRGHDPIADIARLGNALDYDGTTIRRSNTADTGVEIVRTGLAYHLRNSQQFAHTLPEEEVRHALHYPPEYSRAALRAYIIREYLTARTDWDRVTVFTNRGERGITSTILHMPDPLANALDDTQQAILSTAIHRSKIRET